MKIKKTKVKSGAKVNQEVITLCQENRDNLNVSIGYGGNEVTIEGNVLYGGHFKILSAMKQAGLNAEEIKKALA